MIADKITILNKTVLECLSETDEVKIVTCFTEVGLDVIDADFGFVWLDSSASNDLKLVYASPNIPYTPRKPKKDGRNYKTLKSSHPDFVSEIKRRNDKYDVSSYMKSFVIIPIVYKENVYGTMVFCFKKYESFPNEKKILCTFIGNNVAQAITIRHLIEKENIARQRADMLNEVERLLQEEKLKTEFISNITHEIRTPLAIMRGNVDLALINGSNDTKYIKNTFKAINHEIEHLSDMFSDLILLISPGGKIKDKILFKKLNIYKVIKHTAKTFSVIAKKKDISIKVKKFSDVFIIGDGSYLERLFANLIKNAITYGKKGGTISIGCINKKDVAEIYIKDNGVGIRKEDIPHIFKRFYRADKSHGSGLKNTGLGLAIAEWIVLAHGGKIGIESHVDRGTTFTVSLPILK